MKRPLWLLDLISRVLQEGGELLLDEQGRLIGRNIPRALHGMVRANRDAIRDELAWQAQVRESTEAAAADPQGQRHVRLASNEVVTAREFLDRFNPDGKARN